MGLVALVVGDMDCASTRRLWLPCSSCFLLTSWCKLPTFFLSRGRCVCFHFRFCNPAPQKLHVSVIATGLTAPQWLPGVLVLLLLRKELKTHRQGRARKSRLSVRVRLPDNHVLSGDFTKYIDSCYLYSVSATTVGTSLKCLNQKGI